MEEFIKKLLEERMRVKFEEGFTLEHDLQHTNGELAKAAACYAAFPDAKYGLWTNISGELFLQVWPFSLDWFKPSLENRQQDLIKAAQFLWAEYERLEYEKGKELDGHSS